MKTRILQTLVFGVVTVISATPFFVQEAFAQRGYGGWGMGPGMVMGWGGGWLMIAFWVLVLLGLILLIKWLVQMTRGDRDGYRRPDALEILRERYARGEIDRMEYMAKKKDLAL